MITDYISQVKKSEGKKDFDVLTLIENIDFRLVDVEKKESKRNP